MTFEEHKRELLKDEKVRKEYESMQMEFEFVKCMLDHCIALGIEVDEFLASAGVPKEDIDSYMETTLIPNPQFISTALAAMGKKMEIVPVA